MSEKFIDKDDVKKIIQSTVDEIKGKMKTINTNAIEQFYSAPHPTYDRTESFFAVVSHEPDEKYDDTGCTLTYKYSSGDVSVNEWESPWGIIYSGDQEKAFTSAFEYGYHGGPRPDGLGHWSWIGVTKTQAIMDLIQEGINSL